MQLAGGATVEVPDGAHQPHGTFAIAREIHAVGAGAVAIQRLLAARMGSRTNIQLTRLRGPHIGRQGPLCATATCEDPDAHLPSEYDGLEAISLCAQQTSIGDQLMPGSGGTEASHPRHTSDFHEIAGLTRSNAKARSILHSPSDACTFQTCAAAGMPQDSCRTQAASSQFRHNSQ